LTLSVDWQNSTFIQSALETIPDMRGNLEFQALNSVHLGGSK